MSPVWPARRNDSGVAEVDTLPAAIPPYSALDPDAAFLETTLPCGQRLGGNGESQVHGSLPIVWRDPTARRVHAGDSSAAPEEKQDGRLPRIQRYQTRTGIEYTQAEDVSIKSDDGVKIVYVESGLQDVRDDRHGSLHDVLWRPDAVATSGRSLDRSPTWGSSRLVDPEFVHKVRECRPTR